MFVDYRKDVLNQTQKKKLEEKLTQNNPTVQNFASSQHNSFHNLETNCSKSPRKSFPFALLHSSGSVNEGVFQNKHLLTCTHLYFNSRVIMLTPPTNLLQMGSWLSLKGTRLVRPRDEAPSSCRRIILNFLDLISLQTQSWQFYSSSTNICWDKHVSAQPHHIWQFGHCSGGSQGPSSPAESTGLSAPVRVDKLTSLKTA